MRHQKRQRGFSSLEIILYTILLFSGCGLVVAVLVGTFYLAVKKSAFALVPFACFWLWAWSYTSYWGNGPQKWAMAIAVPACEEEIKSIPRRIEVDGVVDEAAFLTWQNIENLLVLRGLDFVETTVRRDSGGRTRYLHPSETNQSGLFEEAKIVKFDLGIQGDVSCVQKLSFSRLKPDSCIRMTLLQAPTARYSVGHSFGTSAIPFAVGNWVLSDSIRNVEIARISTYDTQAFAQLGNPATIGESNSLRDCRGAHALLFDSLYGITRKGGRAIN